MLSSSLPVKFTLPFGANAGATYINQIPLNSQIGITPGRASLNDGFVPLNMVPIGAGGIPPFGQDLNGVLNQTTQWSQWQAAGGPVFFDATFAAAVGGYPRSATLASATTVGLLWINTLDGNTSNPDTGGANWLPISGLGLAGTGDVSWRPTAEVKPGWVPANALTIGNAASNATSRANADTSALFAWHWNNFSATRCPLYNSAGTLVMRGANAAADFAANNAIVVLDMRGADIQGMETMGGAVSTRLTGVPVVSGSVTIAGSIIGENLHALVAAENGPHTHTFTSGSATTSTESVVHSHSINGTTTGMSANAVHSHATTDPQHNHSYQRGNGSSAYGVSTSFAYNNDTATNTTNAATGLTINSVNIDHIHTVAFASSTQSVNHTHTVTATGTTDSSGSGTAHNNVSYSLVGTWYLKL